jgi:hypothetical protein
MLVMKVILISILFVLAMSAIACAYPHQLFLDLPIAESIGDRGLTGYRLNFSPGTGPSLQVGRAITDRLDLWMTTSPSDLFSLEVRALLINRLGPLNLSLDLSQDGFTLLSALLLGPLRIDWGQTIGRNEKEWVTFTASKTPWFSLILGLEHSVRYSFLGGVRLFPGGWYWGLSILMQEQRWTASVGGIF